MFIIVSLPELLGLKSVIAIGLGRCLYFKVKRFLFRNTFHKNFVNCFINYHGGTGEPVLPF